MFRGRQDEFSSIVELNKLTTKQNIRRIALVCYIFMGFQVLNLFDDAFRSNQVLQLGSLLVILICAFYIFYTKAAYKRILDHPGGAKATYLSFWIIMILFGMTPFLLNDAALDRPVNITLFAAMMIIVPMFNRTQVWGVFLFYMGYNLALSFVQQSSLFYKLTIVGICGISVLLSFLVQNNYYGLIVKLRLEARIDPLTGILNRRGGLDKMQTIIELSKRHGVPAAVFVVDIDYFKEFNDRFGHIRGDEVLVTVTREMGQVFERSSDIICRIGGEEFLLCTSLGSEEEARLMAERLCAAIEALEIAAARTETSPYVTVSVGYTFYAPASPDELDKDCMDVLNEADSALFRAKNRGRNCICVFDDNVTLLRRSS